ncbi:MAG: hypothetical protein EAZ07_06085 [Cytophagales bacterium]|nr:MAG: hypothetical protein EAZ07_06085 [Cytophagales bacterium]
MRLQAYFLTLVLIILGNLQSFATNITDVEILKEDINKYQLSDILNNKNLVFSEFKPSNADLIQTSYWLRFNYTNNDPQKSYFLYSPFILYQNLELYFYLNDSLFHFKNSISKNFKERILYSPNIYLELPNTNKPTKCYLHINSFHSYFFFFSEVDSKSIMNTEISQSNIEFFFIGTTMLSILISLIFFAYLKDKLYLYYSLFAFMLLFSRLTYNGYIFNFIGTIYPINNLKAIFNLYALSYGGINIALLLYFHEYLSFYQRSRRYSLVIYSLVLLRLGSLIIHLSTSNPTITKIVDSHWVDLCTQFPLIIISLKTAQKHLKPTLIAIVSLGIVISSNLIYILSDWGILSLNSGSHGYYFFLNLIGIEVVVFAISIAYRNHYLKKQHDKAIALSIENLKESQRIKDNINKELEIKVTERTAQIQQMNELLELHNIKLASEVKDANEARVFQKNMSYIDFKKIFPTDEACILYLANLKRKQQPVIICKKCGYDNHTVLKNHSTRCGKCGYTESVTNGTLFTRLKFPIIKAFYITYITSTSIKETTTLTDLATELDLRLATLWTFKQKVLVLIEANKTKKKHKDGWTHLIEYSIK